MNDSTISKVEHIPDNKSYILFRNDSYLTPGYDRDDPSENVNCVAIEIYETKEDLLKRIEQIENTEFYKPKYRIGVFEPLNISVKIEIKVK